MTEKLLASRDGFGAGLVLAAQKNEAVVALSADLSESLKLQDFRKNFPGRYIECGVAEQNLAGVAAGLSLAGQIPFATSFAAFNPGRNFDQVRNIAYSNLNVKIVGGHAGLATGEDGATHQALEDLSLMISLPNFKVFSPADAKQAQEITLAIAKDFGPSYLRLSRLAVSETEYLLAALQNRVEKIQPFKIGRAQFLTTGSDITMLCHGVMVQEAIRASLLLEQKKISVEVINLPTLKPLDLPSIQKSLHKTRALIILSEEQLGSGFNANLSQQLLSSIGETGQKQFVTNVVAVKDRFGESGRAEELLKKYHLDQRAILEAALLLLHKKQHLQS